MRNHRDRGAAAVEFALVLPLLLLMTMGILAFGYAFHIQTTLDNAARDAVRVAALDMSDDAVALAQQAGVRSAGASIAIEPADVIIEPAACGVGEDVRATITLTDFELLGGLGTITLTGSGTMRCIG